MHFGVIQWRLPCLIEGATLTVLVHRSRLPSVSCKHQSSEVSSAELIFTTFADYNSSYLVRHGPLE
jgi:hypothetical protein